MTSFHVDAVSGPVVGASLPELRREQHSVKAAGRPTIVALASRSGLPLMMLCIVAGTPLWGGYVTLGLALLTWRMAGMLL